MYGRSFRAYCFGFSSYLTGGCMRRNSLSAQLFAEFVGTAVLILFGDGVVANVVFGTRLGAGGYNWDTITLGWAFAVVMAVYVAGGITGAHINPAVTLAAILHKSIAVSTGLLYMVAQVVGAFFGALLVYILYAGNFAKDGYKNVFYTGPAGGYENLVVTQYLTEIIGTFCLLLFIYAIVDSVRNVGPGANLWPFMVGMGVLAIGLSLGGPTGYAINPARDFGPRLMAAIFAGDAKAFSDPYFLVPIIGPLVGGVGGAFFYTRMVQPLLPVKEVQPPPEGEEVKPIEAEARPVA
jgi:glycerol uptake facilitator protein